MQSTHSNYIFIAAAIFILSFLSIRQKANAQTEYIIVQGDQQMDTNTVLMQGFINGGTSFNIPLTQKLKPAFWGFGWDVVAGYDYTVPNFNLKKMASIYSAYMNYYGIGDPLLLQPWTGGWAQWDAFVNNMINQSITTSRPVDFWSVWGEPDATFSGTPAQYIEMFRRTDSILKAVDPTAKLVGPDFIDFGIGELIFFIDSMDAVGVHPEALSWHEFGNYPEVVYLHVQQIKDSLAVRPLSGDPEIHIQEYAGPDNRLIPGWNVGWLYYFEQSKLNWASHACFNEFDGVNTWDDCWNGLSGMYMSDGFTPQPNYWLHRAYAELYQPMRIVTSSSELHTVALASQNGTNQEMKVIVGRYYSPIMGTQNSPANVEVKITNYPFGNNSIQPLLIQKIPAQTVSYSVPLASPINVFSGTVSFVADSATIVLNGFADGDAYIIYINPDLNNILSDGDIPDGPAIPENSIQVYPNPASGSLNIFSSEQNITNIRVLDATGKVVDQNSGSFGQAPSIMVNEYANGLYLIEIMNDLGNIQYKKFVVQH